MNKNILLLLAFLFTSIVSAEGGLEKSAVDQFVESVSTLRVDDQDDEVLGHLKNLENLSERLSRSDAVGDRCILRIASFLDSKNLRIVDSAAIVLGNLGGRAQVAIPHLERAMRRLELEEAKLILGSAQPYAAEIYVALTKIDGRSLPALRRRSEGAN